MKRTAFAPRTKQMSRGTSTLKRTEMARSAASLTIKPKTRKCAICREPFTSFDMKVRWCSIDHGLELAQSLLAKKKERDAAAARRELKVAKDAAKPLKERLKETEKVVNRYVRVRDRYLGCISCDKPASWDGQWHASHFKSVGSNSRLRFHLWNIHKACSECNLFMSGNIAEYEKRLVLKLGAEKVAWLKRQNGVTLYSPDHLDRLKRVLAKRTKRLEKRQAAQTA
jgi:hypothetical protein